MLWEEIREKYVSCWLLIEALDARTECNKRILKQIAVIDTFEESNEALRAYLQLHKTSPERELYIVHTSRHTLDIEEQRWVGIRTR